MTVGYASITTGRPATEAGVNHGPPNNERDTSPDP